MKYTTEQEQILHFAKTAKENLGIEARAGAAKTTTLVAVANALPSELSGLCLAFNTKIRDEMRARMPQNFHAQTLNGLGYAVWRGFINCRTRVDKNKNYRLLREEIERLDQEEKQEVWDRFQDLLKTLATAKTVGYLPASIRGPYKPLVGESEFFAKLDVKLSPAQEELINKLLTKSWRETLRGILDFDDMLLGPAVAGVAFPRYDVVLVDEAQDLSSINHVLVRKVARYKTRLIYAGDPCQAIYSFRGAHETSMQELHKKFDAKTFYLTVSFRCSKEVVLEARSRAPDMKWPEWAKAGEVKTLTHWSANSIPDGSAIICRNNAPLFALAINLLRDGKYPEIFGRDILKNICAKMKKLGKPSMPRAETLPAIADWLEKEKSRNKNHDLLEDIAECMRVFVWETETLGEAIDFAKALDQGRGRIFLMTGHKAKGLEFPNVFFLDQHLLGKDGQEPNLRYVIQTRALENLYYVKSEDYEIE